MKTFCSSTTEVALRYMQALNCPRALTVAIMLRYGEYSQLAELKATPYDYADSWSYSRAVAATDFLRKNADLPSGRDKRSEAIKQFKLSEQTNCSTNARLWKFANGGYLSPADFPLAQFLGQVKEKVSGWLGGLPRRLDITSPSSGAVVELKGMQVNLLHKLTSQPAITAEALPFISYWNESLWGRSYAAAVYRSSPRVVRGDTFFTVPKDSVIDRGCGKGPGLNVAFQLCMGKVLRKRLKAVGIDLVTGQERHGFLAKRASLNGESATVDLRNASNLQATQFVKCCLPDDWFEVLDSLRSHYILIQGVWHKYEMFAPMGNGFTFELETMLFLALACTVCDVLDIPYSIGSEVSVYGDDIFLPVKAVPLFRRVLAFCGLEVNEKKTFSTGPFRESCGSDFWDGAYVRPITCTATPSSPLEWLVLHNQLFEAEARLGLDFSHARQKCVNSVPKADRVFGPPEVAGCFHRSHSWTVRYRNGIEWFRVLVPRVKKTVVDRWGVSPRQAACYLLCGGDGRWVVHRGEPIGHKSARVTRVGISPTLVG